MQVLRVYPLRQTLRWSRTQFIYPSLVATVWVSLYYFLDLNWMRLPWLPISLVGVAVAFFLGFKNNSSYDRLWEARKIWGAIVNASRSWGMMSLDYVTDHFAEGDVDAETLRDHHRKLIYRHIAWMAALRHQLRALKSWEHKDKRAAWSRDFLQVREYKVTLEEELTPLLDEEERKYVLSKKNRATHLLNMQGRHLKELHQQGLTDNFRHVELEKLLVEFFTLQGKSERIRNFPFPRQYATINLIAVFIFVLLMPLGMITAFGDLITDIKLADYWIWLVVPFSGLVGWIFFVMDKIGDYSENPFEGLWNDIPITALSRTIEIDLREMLDETDLPPAEEPHGNILM